MDALLRWSQAYVGPARSFGEVSSEGIPEKVKVLPSDVAGPPGFDTARR